MPYSRSNIKELNQDALYWHYINIGYKRKLAKVLAERFRYKK